MLSVPTPLLLRILPRYSCASYPLTLVHPTFLLLRILPFYSCASYPLTLAHPTPLLLRTLPPYSCASYPLLLRILPPYSCASYPLTLARLLYHLEPPPEVRHAVEEVVEVVAPQHEHLHRAQRTHAGVVSSKCK